MSLSVVLLSSDGFYVGPNDELPVRPEFDKDLLTALARGSQILCSKATLLQLPKSFKRISKTITTNPSDSWNLNFGIATFTALSDVFLIIHSQEPLRDGKKFKIDWLKANYTNKYTSPEISIWLLKSP
jgi:hypothetical protein